MVRENQMFVQKEKLCQGFPNDQSHSEGIFNIHSCMTVHLSFKKKTVTIVKLSTRKRNTSFYFKF